MKERNFFPRVLICLVLAILGTNRAAAQKEPEITTTSLPKATVGAAYSETLNVKDGKSPFTWSLASGSLPAGITLSNAGRLAGTPMVAGASTFTVRVIDARQEQDTQPLTLTVDPSPLAITTSSLPNGTVGQPYSQSLAVSGGAGGNTWSVANGSLPPGLNLIAAGAIGGTPSTAGNSNFTVRVTDSRGGTATQALAIRITAPPLTIVTNVLPNGTIGQAYSQTLAASGGTGSNTWSVASGSLPAGLTLSGAGVISGNPRSAGNSSFAVRVADSSGAAATKPLSITIASAQLTITTTALPNAIVGAAYSQTLAVSGGNPPYRWTVTGGPPGITIGASSGVLAGTPGLTGQFNVAITVTDALSAVAQKQLTLSVGQDLTLATSAALPNGVAGVPYTFTLLATGGTPPFSWSVVDGALPSGLVLNPTSGVLAGTPAANGTFNFNVRVRDSAQMTATFPHSLVVAASTLPEISISGLPAEVQPLQQLSINLDLSVPYALPVNGTLNLSFTPLGGGADDPSIQFSTGGRSAAFSIAANSTRATFGAQQVAIQTGSVAGTIRLTISSLQSAGSSISLPVNPIQTLQLNPAPPSIRRITLVRTSSGIDVQLTALSDTRELTEAQVTFQPAPGSSLQTPVLTVPLTNLARTWFQSGDSIPFGGQVHITLPFTFTGSVSLSSVAVTLANGMGKSAAATANN